MRDGFRPFLCLENDKFLHRYCDLLSKVYHKYLPLTHSLYETPDT